MNGIMAGVDSVIMRPTRLQEVFIVRCSCYEPRIVARNKGMSCLTDGFCGLIRSDSS